jgi:Golgi phosphoprotein 3 (GPP34)
MTRPAGSSRVPAPSLAGTGRLADDLYLMAHHERTGRPLLAPRAAGLGLAGGLLGELLLADAIRICHGDVITSPAPPHEVLADTILRQVAGEAAPRPVADWLAVLSRTAHDEVASRLEQAGYLVAVEARPWRPLRWVPSDPDCAFAPVARLKAALDVARPATADAQTLALAGLAAACGLTARLTSYLPTGSRSRMEQAAGRLDADLREVITCTQATVGAALLAHRL